MSVNLLPLVANGNIAPSRFIKVDPAGDNNKALQAGAGENVIGISQKGTRNTPFSSLDDGFCAIAGESFQYFGQGQTAPLELGGTVTAGDYLKADADGKGVTASSTNRYGAQTAVDGVAGQIIEVLVVLGTL